MKKSYVNIEQLKNSGTRFMRPQDKLVFDKSLTRIEKLEGEALGSGTILPFEEEAILEEYWREVSKPSDIFQQYYSSIRKRKKLLIVFNIPYEGKRISTDASVLKLLRLFEQDESEIVLNRWVSTLINSWEDLISVKSNFEAITTFIRQKFLSTPLTLRRSKLLANNQHLFLDPQGAHTFAKEVIERKTTHAQLCEQVGIRFDQSSYHARVVEELFAFYLKTKKYNEVEEIVENIAKSPSDFSIRSRKKIISAFILHVEAKELEAYKKLAQSTAFSSAVIGDPEKSSNWTVWEGGNDADKKQMKDARLTLNKWILTAFVDVFFNLLINDPARKAYWMEKIPLISSVKVYGSSDVKKILQGDVRIRNYVNFSRFSMIYSGSSSNAAILMEIGAYQIIEFSDSGALYCYEKLKERIPKHIDSLSDLKQTQMPLACSLKGNYYHLNLEGRIVHSGNSGRLVNGVIIEKASWMNRMDSWIEYFAS